jgi:hypothetical protein
MQATATGLVTIQNWKTPAEVEVRNPERFFLDTPLQPLQDYQEPAGVAAFGIRLLAFAFLRVAVASLGVGTAASGFVF